MKTCNSCLYWSRSEKTSFGNCSHPKVSYVEWVEWMAAPEDSPKPVSGGVMVGGEEKPSGFMTDENFGCINHTH